MGGGGEGEVGRVRGCSKYLPGSMGVPTSPTVGLPPPPAELGGVCSVQSQELTQSIFARISLICTFLFSCDVTIALS